MAGVSGEARDPRRSKSLRADIRAANQAAAGERSAANHAAAAQRKELATSATRWIQENDKERNARIVQQKQERDRRRARRRANLDQAFVDDHVTPEAQAHGEYVKDTTPGPNIIKNGEEVPTSLEVVRNRGGSAIERWHARGDLSIEQIEAITLYARAWRMVYGGVQARTTANWSMVASVRNGTTPIEVFTANALQSKTVLRHIDDVCFFGKPLHYFEIWQNVVIFDEPTGTAGSRAGYKNKQAEAAAKMVVQLVADTIAVELRLGRRPPR